MKGTPYSYGFNDAVDGVYYNPFPRGSAKWQAYNNGYYDAKRNKRNERTQH